MKQDKINEVLQSAKGGALPEESKKQPMQA